jgi:hypothetical protein
MRVTPFGLPLACSAAPGLVSCHSLPMAHSQNDQTHTRCGSANAHPGKPNTAHCIPCHTHDRAAATARQGSLAAPVPPGANHPLHQPNRLVLQRSSASATSARHFGEPTGARATRLSSGSPRCHALRPNPLGPLRNQAHSGTSNTGPTALAVALVAGVLGHHRAVLSQQVSPAHRTPPEPPAHVGPLGTPRPGRGVVQPVPRVPAESAQCQAT